MYDLNKRSSISSINICIILALSMVSFCYFVFFQRLIPIKFKLDSGIIRLNMLSMSITNNSYRNASKFFQLLGMSYNTPMVFMNIFSWIIFVLLLLTVIRINKYKTFTLFQIILLIYLTILYGFYFTNYSKDIIVIIFFIMAVNLPHLHNNILINIIISILIYGVLFRQYWILIGLLSVIPLLIKHIRLKKDLIYICLSIIIIIIIYNVLRHNQITNARALVNRSRILTNDSNDKSMINNLVPNTSIMSDVINYIYVLITLFVPIQGISSFNVIIYYVWIIGLVLFSIKYRYYINLRLLLLLIIYINIQALFEPDLGSVFRHQLAWFVIIYYTLNCDKTRLIKMK